MKVLNLSGIGYSFIRLFQKEILDCGNQQICLDWLLHRTSHSAPALFGWSNSGRAFIALVCLMYLYICFTFKITLKEKAYKYFMIIYVIVYHNTTYLRAATQCVEHIKKHKAGECHRRVTGCNFAVTHLEIKPH